MRDMKMSKNILKTKYKLAVLTSHPIQYQAPLFQKMAQQSEIDLTIYFCWDFGVSGKTYDAEFGKEIKWDIPILEGYKYKLLKNFSFEPSSKFWGQINFGIIEELIANKYDAVIIFGWNSPTNWLAFLTAFLNGTPVFLRGENPLNQEFLKPEWKREVKKIILGWLFKHISAFLYLGEENKKFYQYYGADNAKLFFCPYAVDNERFISKAQSVNREAFRKKLGVKKDDVVILFVGKLIGKKRPMDLLKAYEILQSAGRKAQSVINRRFALSDLRMALLFVGDGALRSELENYVQKNNLKNVNFVGFKNQTEMPEYYALADILVLPSESGETWGLVANEIMCFAKPVIVSDVVGCGPNLVKPGENGYIFPLGDIEKLSQYLKNLIKNPRKIKSFGQKSFTIIQNYSYEKDIDCILKALNN